MSQYKNVDEDCDLPYIEIQHVVVHYNITYRNGCNLRQK